MKTQYFVAALAMLLFPHSFAVAQGTAFTYQGRLTDGIAPANGVYDLRFTICDALAGGVTVAGPATNAAVAVSNGLFTVTLDFGAVFNGAARWLEIGVRPGGSASDFTTLAPRQAISPTPYAMFAATAGTVPNGAITANKLAAGAAAGNLSAGGQSAVGGGGVVLSEQFNAAELLSVGYQKIGRANLVDEAWLQRASGPAGLPPVLARRGHSAVWTGTEMIIWGGVDKDGALLDTGARYNPAAGTWTRLSASNAPAARASHRAVWTGTEMIVWGGSVFAFFLGNSGTVVTNTGGRYNPATDTWTPITPGGGNRQNHSTFWTGSEMLVWGGTIVSGSTFGASISPRNDGARYNPLTDTWTSINTTNRPSVRFDYSAVFTGTEMIIWGGQDVIGTFFGTLTNYNDGARYNLAANTWAPVSLTGAPFRRFGHSAVWSGTEMIVWGGKYAEGSLEIVSSNYNNGARYNPAANTWSGLSTAGAPSARLGHGAVWAGNRMVVWGGGDGTNAPLDSGARYFPAVNAWSNMTSAVRPVGRTGHTTIWSGSEMIVWGGQNEFLRDLGGRYQPSNDVWTPTPPTGERSARRGHTAIWTGNEVLVWGGFDGERYLNTGGRYIPSLNSWTPITTNGAPEGRAAHTAVWTGTEMIVWGGAGTGGFNTGGRFNPTTGLWTLTATNGAPTARVDHTAVWTGSQMVIWGGLDGALINTGGRYDPANNTWTATATANAPTGRTRHAAVWTGTEMLVWGGAGGTLASPVVLSNGGRYNLNNNTWANLPALNAPAGRFAHRAVWSGDEMLVWGGTDLTTNLNTGGRYKRTGNSWSAITTNNAPPPRTEHTIVWDGTRMIVWGGPTDDSFYPTGGIYNPLTDGWVPTQSSTNAPPMRGLHTAVWTGSEMVVHGGYNSDSSSGATTYLDDTWHYTPPRTMFLYLKP